ncbi:Nif3-like dinuclear metal center hexameric protein [Brevibacterium litoralis]|uniref:Nif3-like dinuclear metal center hexameric protein n=1 Tax=Brevibacterium litoralis TaxID=3138935 RepID=UPI0032EC6D53
MHTPTVSDLVSACDALWPPEYAESWDTVGLAVGDPDATVRKVLFALDPTDAVVEKAVSGGYDLLLTHHPLMLRGVTSVSAATLKGGAVHRLIRAGVAQFNAHTNADSALGGVTDVLADLIDLRDRQPLAPTAGAPEGVGIGRVGSLSEPRTVAEVARTLAAAVPATVTGVRIAGAPEAPVTRVAVLGGAGDSMFEAVRAHDVDLYITSDLRHHPATEARDTAHRTDDRPHLVDVVHWAAESPWCEVAADQLSVELDRRGFAVDIDVDHTVTDPWTLRIDQGTHAVPADGAGASAAGDETNGNGDL